MRQMLYINMMHLKTAQEGIVGEDTSNNKLIFFFSESAGFADSLFA